MLTLDWFGVHYQNISQHFAINMAPLTIHVLYTGIDSVVDRLVYTPLASEARSRLPGLTHDKSFYQNLVVSVNFTPALMRLSSKGQLVTEGI